MYDVNMVRGLCAEVAKEQDPEKSRDLVSLLQAVIKDDAEEIKLRMSFLTQRYASAITRPCGRGIANHVEPPDA